MLQAWKQRQSKARLDELAETFEDIEHQGFGKDGFDRRALARITRIEQTRGMGISIAIPYRLRRTEGRS